MADRRLFIPGDYTLRTGRSRNGRGVFAQEPVPKGACIIEYTGKPATAHQMATNRGRYLFWTGRGTMIDGNIAGNRARFINHSCTPNCETDLRDRRVFIFAARDIAAGEELTYDYGDEYTEMYLGPGRCRCAACAPLP